MGNILEVKDLCKTYVIDKRQNNVLRNVNFKIEEGDMVAIMGPSGSGKSTLLYSVSGMDTPTSGTVLFDGKDITKLSEHKRAPYLGRVFQDPMTGTAATMSIDENLAIDFEIDVSKIPASNYEENTIFDKPELYGEALAVLFINKIEQAISEKLTEIRALDNDIEKETSVII